MTKTNWKILGTDDAQTVCELCGKSNLKKVVHLENVDTLAQIAVGTDCAGQLVFGKKTRKNTSIIKAQANEVRLAKKWLDNGYSLEQVAYGIRARGYSVTCADGKMKIGGFGEIAITERG